MKVLRDCNKVEEVELDMSQRGEISLACVSMDREVFGVEELRTL